MLVKDLNTANYGETLQQGMSLPVGALIVRTKRYSDHMQAGDICRVDKELHILSDMQAISVFNLRSNRNYGTYYAHRFAMYKTEDEPI